MLWRIRARRSERVEMLIAAASALEASRARPFAADYDASVLPN
jgi:hypothetical protein